MLRRYHCLVRVVCINEVEVDVPPMGQGGPKVEKVPWGYRTRENEEGTDEMMTVIEVADCGAPASDLEKAKSRRGWYWYQSMSKKVTA